MTSSLAMRSTSPVAGLHRRRLGTWEVTAQSVSAVAPTAAVTSSPALVGAVAGGSTVLAFALATVLMLMVAYCISQCARRISTAGSLYTFTAQGLGPRAALLSASSLVIGYAAITAASTAIAAGYLAALLQRSGLASPSPLVTATLVLLLGGLVISCIAAGVSLSARLALGLEAASVLAVLVLGVSLLVRGGFEVPPVALVGTPLDLQRLAAGAALAVVAFVGFESCCALGVEARKPLRTIPRVVVRTVAVMGVLYVLGSATELSALFSPGSATTDPLGQLTNRTGMGWLAPVLEVGILTSGLACATASGNALVRVLFTLSREGLLPPALGRTHPRRGTPHRGAVLALSPVAVTAACAVGWGASPYEVFAWSATLAAAGSLTAYVLVCAATPVLLGRIGELTPAPLLLCPLAAGAVASVLLALLLPGLAGTRPTVTLAFVLLEAAGLVLLLLRRRCPDVVGAVLYDEPLQSDVFVPAGTHHWRQP